MKAAVVDAVGAGFKIAEVELARPLGRAPIPGCTSTGGSNWTRWCQPRSAWTRLSPATRSSPIRTSPES